jgi:hypothetical protein
MASCRKEASMMVTDNYTSTTISQSALSFVQPACGQASAPSAQVVWGFLQAKY